MQVMIPQVSSFAKRALSFSVPESYLVTVQGCSWNAVLHYFMLPCVCKRRSESRHSCL